MNADRQPRAADRSDTLSATPLLSVSAVVVDTETTGLDTDVARIIQIGAVHIDTGAVTDTTFETLVDPGVPIPPLSTGIHGIGDADVTGADRFETAFEAFADFASHRLVIGYSIGFDLAVIRREFERLGRAWDAPRALDVRHLIRLVAPPLPDDGLETVASWLGIDTVNRHRALADAVMTAEVFVALVPKLRERGIRTLGEAESTCAQLSEQRSTEARAGWVAADQERNALPDTIRALARIDSFPYRHRVRDIMSSPPSIIGGDKSLREVLALLMDRQISSVFVSGDGDNGPGIITERDVLRAIDADADAALVRPARDLAVRPLITVGADDHVYRAIGRMASDRLRHLGVCDEDGNLVGAVSARDLLKQRAGDAISISDSIDSAKTAEELGLAWARLTMVARSLAYEEVDARDIAAIISTELRALTRQACRIAEAEIERAGGGTPPVAYAMMVLGSGGRGESLLAMDQDNAIIFETGAAGGPEDKWFERLGTRVADILNSVGVAYCKGGIMASNADWRMSVEAWHEAVSGWIRRSTPEDILNTDIFFDCMAVHGEVSLAQALREEAIAVAAGSGNFLHLLTHNAADVNPLIGWFGRLRTEEGRVGLKKGGIMPIFSAARVLALRHGISARSTPERLEAARPHLGTLGDKVPSLIDAHKILLGAILNQQLRDLDTGTALSNAVAPKEMSAAQLDRMKWAVQQTHAVPDLLGTPHPV